MPGVWFLWSKKNIHISFFFQKEKGNTFTLLNIFIVKTLQKEKIAQIYYYEPKTAGINVQSPQSESTPRRLTLACLLSYMVVHLHHKIKSCDLFLPYMSQIKIEKRNEEFLMTLPKVCAGYRYVRKYLVVWFFSDMVNLK